MAWEEFKYAETDTVLPAYIMVVDELASFFNTQGDRKLLKYVDKFQENINSVAALGRAAHIHILLSTQTPTGNLFPNTLKENIAFRAIAGPLSATMSRIAIDSESAVAIPKSPGSYLGWSKNDEQMYQGYFIKTKDVLALGTVKEGFDSKTGLPIGGDDFDMSPVEDEAFEEAIEDEEKVESSGSFEEVELNNHIDDVFGDSSEDSDDLDGLLGSFVAERHKNDKKENVEFEESSEDSSFSFEELSTKELDANSPLEGSVKKQPKKLKITSNNNSSLKIGTTSNVKSKKPSNNEVVSFSSLKKSSTKSTKHSAASNNGNKKNHPKRTGSIIIE